MARDPLDDFAAPGTAKYKTETNRLNCISCKARCRCLLPMAGKYYCHRCWLVAGGPDYEHQQAQIREANGWTLASRLAALKAYEASLRAQVDLFLEGQS